ncbi:penicillin-binding protein 2 [Aquimonas voraii]|uniref:Peptidoglycan D,D-transpeptidase MrdA n=1 Tax=Aquimonas voraii TaxID=265719 RepID=A0A1G7A4T0_9GAMM|nr:penicillin-binding protein 2 [Aquimonas voraii]SDE09770.1 peptidoglycan glycosyltransferase [Aquimonas voraii]
MRGVRRLRDAAAEARLFRSRAAIAFVLALVVLAALGTRFAHLQVVRHEEYATESEANRIRSRPIVPARGLIYDRAGRLLADNVPAYRLELVPEQVEDLDATLRSLTELLQLTEEDLQSFEADRLSKRRFQAVPLKLRLSESEVARFAVRRHEFPGVDVVPYLTRRYPYGELLAHVIGYVGRIDAQDQEILDPARYRGATHVGKSGIERFYESRLHGQVGIERVEINAEGRTLRVLERQAAESGEHLYLSLDLELQQAAVSAFAGQSGAAVAMDPRTGEVLAMVSLPSYDPNPFVNGIGRAAYADLLNAPSRPLFNRVLLGGYEPGSTLKPFIGLAGLELGLRRPSDTVFSSGAFRLPGQEREYRDWRRGGHGTIDLRESLAQSVNTYYYQLALDLGIERLTGYVAQFGFGAPTGIDLIGESSGILPTPAWKRAARNQPWYPGETVIAGIGQGFWVTTPLQLAYATAILAAGGERHPPHLLRSAQAGFDAEIVQVDVPPLGPPLSIRPDHLEAVVEGMEAVMHGPTGTARAMGEGLSYRIASKTGTAQRVSRSGATDVDPSRLTANQRNQALFIAFAPASEPTIALALVIEAGGSGTRAAAPVARQILDAWILREAAP